MPSPLAQRVAACEQVALAERVFAGDSCLLTGQAQTGQHDASQAVSSTVLEQYACHMCKDMGWLYAADGTGTVVWEGGKPEILLIRYPLQQW